jgi:UDP-glucose 4-epimerase
MRVVVTGVAGLIGSWVAEALCQREEIEKVFGLDDMSGGTWPNVNLIKSQKFVFDQMDCCDEGRVNELFASQRPQMVVHCAAIAREGASSFQPLTIVKSNALMSMNLLEKGIKWGMRKFVFFSSMAVMGDQKPPFDEKMPRKPVDCYGISKAATEESIEALQRVHGFEYTIIRPHNVVGPRQALFDPYRNACGIFINRIMRHEPIFIFGEGHKRAFYYIEDSLPAFIKAITTDKIRNDIVFIGGKEEVTIDELAEEVIKNFSEFPRPEIIRLPPRPLEVKEAYCSIEKSVKRLGYEEKIGWREGVKRMCEWGKKMGSQQWRVDKLPLTGENLPRPWAELQ